MSRLHIGPIVKGLLSRSKRKGGAARVYRGDDRDVERIKKVQEIMDNKENLPKFLFKPMSDWSDRDWEEANNDPFEALKILRAMRRETPHLSNEFIACVWVFMQDGVFPEFKTMTKLDDTNNLPFAKPRGGKSLADAVKNQLPEGFYDASDFAQEEGVFYVQVPVQSCEAMNAAIDAMKLEKDTDEIFFDNSRLNADELLANDLTFGATLYSGQSDRDADVRLAEKAQSTQLFGRHLRATVCVNIPSELGVAVDADGDDDQLPDSDPEASDDNVSYEDLIDSVASRMAVLNKVFATKRFFAAVARVACGAYSARNRGFSAMEEDFEAMIAAVTGSMIERGGTNVALLGCLPGKEQTRIESMRPARRAFCWMKDDAFIEMQRGGCDVDTFEEAYTDVKGRLAETVFAKSHEFLGRLEALAAAVEKNGVAGVLAAADAEAFEGADPPTYHNMDAGTFARALAAEAGRKGAATRAQMCADVDTGMASPKVFRSVENMRNGMGGRTPDEHYAASVAGGGVPRTPAGTTCGTCKATETSGWYNSPDGSGGKVCQACYARARAERLSEAGTTCGTCKATETSCWYDSPDGSGGKVCQTCYTRARAKRQSEAGTTCGTCETTETSCWYNSPDGSGGKVCQTCYARARAKRQSEAGTTCGTCETTETRQWYNSPDGSGGKVCQTCYTRARAKRQSEAGTTCGTCETTETIRWHNSPDGSGGKVCATCYTRARAERQSEAGTTCGTCETTETRQWYNSPDGSGGNVCATCYTRARAKRQSEAGTTCGTCETTETSCWYNSPDGSGGKVCQTCYARARAKRQSEAGTTCGTCETTETSQWYNSPDGSGGKVCATCYARARAERLSKAGTTCGTCETTETRQWYNSPDGSGGKVCKACYLKARRRKKQKK